MSDTAQICLDVVVAFSDDQGVEQHPPHSMAAMQGGSDVDECQRMLEAAEKMKASLILVNQTLETWLAVNARLAALCEEQPEGALAPAGMMLQLAVSPPQSPFSPMTHDHEVDMPSTWLSESPSRSDDAVDGPEENDFPMDVSGSWRHSPEPDEESYDSGYYSANRPNLILFGDEGFDKWY
ncbi:uncharacterized protein TRAVEDRAFT_48150 [Trametes versicolor FP-101664 SS1]|uniref:uncharacterized protein n=1 Tax=Trametes versicolor (strain FP-101664) TaxID=717944 RepID=UPI0004621E9C|nr:uncharacterized protein TRAVEDRAFT_48150 [Trametes versicolor FP-101664 SS1]EIW59023.1 hypothetical protein TRAVEDRAFT_48150 [Trametes versicolor FP-101664 SS1]